MALPSLSGLEPGVTDRRPWPCVSVKELSTWSSGQDAGDSEEEEKDVEINEQAILWKRKSKQTNEPISEGNNYRVDTFTE